MYRPVHVFWCVVLCTSVRNGRGIGQACSSNPPSIIFRTLAHCRICCLPCLLASTVLGRSMLCVLVGEGRGGPHCPSCVCFRSAFASSVTYIPLPWRITHVPPTLACAGRWLLCSQNVVANVTCIVDCCWRRGDRDCGAGCFAAAVLRWVRCRVRKGRGNKCASTGIYRSRSLDQ